MKVTVVGAAGHVGLPLSLVLAEAGHQVFGLDINSVQNERIMQGIAPYSEEQMPELLPQVLATGRLQMTDRQAVLAESDVAVIIIGTPIDENLNPRLDDLLNFFRATTNLWKEQLVVLRSTVSPGTTDMIRNFIIKRQRKSLDLVFAPERVIQGKAIAEIKQLPQIIGAYDQHSYERAAAFFSSIISGPTLQLTPIEAELAKLITNMARYVGFALANEFHLICQTFGANACRIIDACNKDYPRMNMPVPGPNVGGPCLYKDGWFLIDRIPYAEIISASFRINEGMTMQIVQRVTGLFNQGGKAGILGMTFKANSDDLRNSLSFKLRRQLQYKGFDTVCIEPNCPGFSQIGALEHADVVVLMTPHRQFQDLERLVEIIGNPDCWFVDLWGFWPEMRHRSRNGYFQARDI